MTKNRKKTRRSKGRQEAREEESRLALPPKRNGLYDPANITNILSTQVATTCNPVTGGKTNAILLGNAPSTN